MSWKTICAIAGLFAICGCASMAGLGGKAHYVQSFSDVESGTVNDSGTIVPGQKTDYKLDIKGPAGMEWAEITNMNYKWDVDKGGEIGINSQSNADTLATAAAIQAVIPAMVEATKAGFLEGVSTVGGLVGLNIQTHGANTAAKDQLDAATRGQIIDFLKSLGMQAVAPAPGTTNAPLIGVPNTR